jgi:hypothetical protein
MVSAVGAIGLVGAMGLVGAIGSLVGAIGTRAAPSRRELWAPNVDAEVADAAQMLRASAAPRFGIVGCEISKATR